MATQVRDRLLTKLLPRQGARAREPRGDSTPKRVVGRALDDDIHSGSDRGLVRDDANRPPPDQILLNPPGGQLPFDTTTLGDRAEEIGWPLVRNPSYDLPEF